MTTMGLNYLNYAETKRNNLANIAETNRHNVTTEGIQSGTLSESIRHNLVGERISQGNLDESVRHNKVTEDVSYGNLKENIRHNTTTEVIQRDTLGETKRHNVVSEDIGKSQTESQRLSSLAAQSQAETAKQNAATAQAKQVEDVRHNKQTESIMTSNNIFNAFASANAPMTGLDYVYKPGTTQRQNIMQSFEWALGNTLDLGKSGIGKQSK